MTRKEMLGRFVILGVIVAAMMGFLVYHNRQMHRTDGSNPTGGAQAVLSQKPSSQNQVALIRLHRDQAQSRSEQQLSRSGGTAATANLARDMRWQSECEALMKSQGFGQVAVIIDGAKVEIVAPAPLQQPRVAALAEIVRRVTGLPYQNMIVMPAG